MTSTPRRALAAAAGVVALAAAQAPPATALVRASPQPAARGSEAEHGTGALEAAATRASDTARAVAMSLIGLALAVAATVLAFRRDFKEAAGVLMVGGVAVLLATPAGLSLLRATVTSLFGSG
jgi:hypothetical protein